MSVARDLSSIVDSETDDLEKILVQVFLRFVIVCETHAERPMELFFVFSLKVSCCVSSQNQRCFSSGSLCSSTNDLLG